MEGESRGGAAAIEGGGSSENSCWIFIFIFFSFLSLFSGGFCFRLAVMASGGSRARWTGGGDIIRFWLILVFLWVWGLDNHGLGGGIGGFAVECSVIWEYYFGRGMRVRVISGSFLI